MTPVEEAFTGKRDEMGEVFVVFSWKKKDYRVSVRRFTEEDE